MQGLVYLLFNFLKFYMMLKIISDDKKLTYAMV